MEGALNLNMADQIMIVLMLTPAMWSHLSCRCCVPLWSTMIGRLSPLRGEKRLLGDSPCDWPHLLTGARMVGGVCGGGGAFSWRCDCHAPLHGEVDGWWSFAVFLQSPTLTEEWH